MLPARLAHGIFSPCPRLSFGLRSRRSAGFARKTKYNAVTFWYSTNRTIQVQKSLATQLRIVAAALRKTGR